MNRRPIQLHGYEDTPAKSWEVFAAARNVLGHLAVERIFGNRSNTQIKRWARNPEFTEDSQRNPIDWLRMLFQGLADVGEEELAVDALRILAEPLGVQIVAAGAAQVEEGQSIHGQFAQLFKSANTTLQLAESREHPNIIDKYADEGMDEFTRFKALYRKLWCAEDDACGARFSRKEIASPGFWELLLLKLEGGNDHGDNDKAQGEDPGAAAC